MNQRQHIQDQINEIMQKATERPGEGGAIVGIGRAWLAAALQALVWQSEQTETGEAHATDNDDTTIRDQ